jgi:hypothetical protein
MRCNRGVSELRSSVDTLKEEGFVDIRTATEVTREAGELKREVADLRAAVNLLRWEAFIRDVHARIDASCARLHDKLISGMPSDEFACWLLPAAFC